MARTTDGARLSERHRARQVALTARVRREFAQLWPLWQVQEARSFDRLVSAALPLIEARRVASAETASQYVAAFAMVEGASRPTVADLAAFDRDRAATSLYVTGEAQAGRAVAAGQPPVAARTTALTTVTGALVRHVLEGGRQVLEDTATETRAVEGWQRVTGPSPCAFCAMLAARGPVYSDRDAGQMVVGRMGKWDRRDRGTTTRDASRPINPRGNRQIGESYHDHCVCSVEMVYEGSELTGEARRFRELWDEAQRIGGSEGTSNDALNNFRRLYERRVLAA